jgi:hypothetical protein
MPRRAGGTGRTGFQGGQATVDWGGFQGTPGCFQAGADLIVPDFSQLRALLPLLGMKP